MNNVLIFGGAGGIGSEIVKKFASLKDYNIIYIDINENINLNKSSNIFFEFCDVTNISCLLDLKTRIETKYGQISHLISLAGRAIESEFFGLKKMTYDDILNSINLNLVSHINICKTFIDLFLNDYNQSISLVSSINALSSFGLPAYSAAKAGLIGFMNGLVNELGESNIRINCFSLGTVETEATKKEPKNFDDHLAKTKLKRFTNISEVAKAIYAITFDLTSMTGQNIIIDAGQSV